MKSKLVYEITFTKLRGNLSLIAQATSCNSFAKILDSGLPKTIRPHTACEIADGITVLLNGTTVQFDASKL